MTTWRIVHKGHRIELFFENSKYISTGDYQLILHKKSENIVNVGIKMSGNDYAFPINKSKYDINYAVWSVTGKRKLTIFIPERGKENALPKGKSVKYTIARKNKGGKS